MQQAKLLAESIFKSLTESVTPPTYELLSWKLNAKPSGRNRDHSQRYFLVRFAYDDEGTNMIALIDTKAKKILRYSRTGTGERDKFKQLLPQADPKIY